MGFWLIALLDSTRTGSTRTVFTSTTRLSLSSESILSYESQGTALIYFLFLLSIDSQIHLISFKHLNSPTSIPCSPLATSHTRSAPSFPSQPPTQSHPPRRPDQLDRQPRPQTPRISRSYRRGQEEQRFGQGIKAQPHSCSCYLEEAQHVSFNIYII